MTEREDAEERVSLYKKEEREIAEWMREHSSFHPEYEAKQKQYNLLLHKQVIEARRMNRKEEVTED